MTQSSSSIERVETERLEEHLAVNGWSAMRSLTAAEITAVVSELLALRRHPMGGEGVPQDVINLVIAARELFDQGHAHDNAEANALDRALEPFASRVPYENEPDDAQLSGEG